MTEHVQCDTAVHKRSAHFWDRTCDLDTEQSLERSLRAKHYLFQDLMRMVAGIGTSRLITLTKAELCH